MLKKLDLRTAYKIKYCLINENLTDKRRVSKCSAKAEESFKHAMVKTFDWTEKSLLFNLFKFLTLRS